MLSPEEKIILDYLKPMGKHFATVKEVCRRAGGKTKFSEEPDWAKRLLKRMEKKGILEVNALGHYRIKPTDDGKERKSIPMDPKIRQILAQSGKDFSKVFELEDPDSTGGGQKPD